MHNNRDSRFNSCDLFPPPLKSDIQYMMKYKISNRLLDAGPACNMGLICINKNMAEGSDNNGNILASFNESMMCILTFSGVHVPSTNM